ncbi:hypothetical protein BDW59DRAFT_164766 [Aspergillus cavernicola]|uniref:Uncharacterized protein n=1 Tax=Aspergillus cavernicola TaxID=176166 RepID=A0ABR4HZQ6_9EURO
MEQHPTVIIQSPSATAETVMMMTDSNLPAAGSRSSVRGSRAPLPCPHLPESVQQSNTGLQEHVRRHDTPLLSPGDNPYDADYWHRQYLQSEGELAAERGKISQLQAANQKGNDEALAWRKNLSKAEERLEDEKWEHDQTKLKLQQKQQDVNKWHGLLLEANREMGSATNHQQIRHQLEDTEIAMRTKRLRVDIRDFALEYGEIKEGDFRAPASSYSLLKKYLCVPEQTLDAYIKSPSDRPIIVRAFLWAFLDAEVFSRFNWAPTDIGNAMQSLCGLIEPSDKYLSDTGAEVERKRVIWRANTTSLLLETMDGSTEKTYDSYRGFVSKNARSLADWLEPIVCRNSRDIIGPLSKLLEESLALDEALSQQVAKWTWYFPRTTPCQFDKTMMDSSTHKRRKGQAYEVHLVLAPALKKRGRSSGDDFHVNEVQVKMEVEIDLPRQAGSGSRSWLNLLRTKT